jgi:hypothetical protein
LVHGGQIKDKDLRKAIRAISTVPDDAVERRFGVAVGYAIDRMRDLVRRAILARLCLAVQPDPLWRSMAPLASMQSLPTTPSVRHGGRGGTSALQHMA